MTEDMTMTAPEQGQALSEMGAAMGLMARTIAELREDVRQLRGLVAQLEKVSPMQARALNALIRERAKELAARWRIPEEKTGAVATAIRRELRLETGARSMSDIARCDAQVARELVETWEDPAVLRKLREG